MRDIRIFFIIILIFFTIYIFWRIWVVNNQPIPNIVVTRLSVINPDIIKPIEQIVPDINEKMNSKIPEIVEWDGTDPYPRVDWSGIKPELKITVDNFGKEWGQPLQIRQAYRPSQYGKHIRSVWEVWQYLNGKSYMQGYKCENFTHIDTKKIGILNQAQKDYLNKEVYKHGFANGDTPPSCESDHAKGIAVDITPPINLKEYERFINTAYSVGLCHYIAGDEPHFGLRAYLPKEINCFQK